MGLAAFNRMRRERVEREQVEAAKAEQEQKPIEQMTVPELKKLAKEKGVEGCDNMKKAELLTALSVTPEDGGNNDGGGSTGGNETQMQGTE